ERRDRSSSVSAVSALCMAFVRLRSDRVRWNSRVRSRKRSRAISIADPIPSFLTSCRDRGPQPAHGCSTGVIRRASVQAGTARCTADGPGGRIGGTCTGRAALRDSVKTGGWTINPGSGAMAETRVRGWFAWGAWLGGAGLVLAAIPASAQTPAEPDVTFTRDIAPIFQKACESCHRKDSIAPMSLVTYEETRPWA